MIDLKRSLNEEQVKLILENIYSETMICIGLVNIIRGNGNVLPLNSYTVKYNAEMIYESLLSIEKNLTTIQLDFNFLG